MRGVRAGHAQRRRAFRRVRDVPPDAFAPGNATKTCAKIEPGHVGSDFVEPTAARRARADPVSRWISIARRVGRPGAGAAVRGVPRRHGRAFGWVGRVRGVRAWVRAGRGARRVFVRRRRGRGRDARRRFDRRIREIAGGSLRLRVRLRRDDGGRIRNRKRFLGGRDVRENLRGGVLRASRRVRAFAVSVPAVVARARARAAAGARARGGAGGGGGGHRGDGKDPPRDAASRSRTWTPRRRRAAKTSRRTRVGLTLVGLTADSPNPRFLDAMASLNPFKGASRRDAEADANAGRGRAAARVGARGERDSDRGAGARL